MIKSAGLGIRTAFAALLIVSTSIANAQSATSVSEVRAGVAAIGKQWNGEVNAATQALYAELHRGQDDSGIQRHSDIAYGSHPLQKFDMFVPRQGFGEPGPVLIYIHGGGLVRGNKINPNTDELIYSNVGKFAARFGGIGINANYRLVPDAQWPSGAEDIRLIIEWVHENISEYGGDPDNILIMGNSAGATHVASYLFHEASQLSDGPGVRAAILSSGGFASGDGDAQIAYYGPDPRARFEHSPLGLVESYEGEQVPLIMWSAQYDPAGIESSVAAMYSALCVKYQDCPMFTQLQGHNHVSHVMSIDSPDDEVGQLFIRFYHSLEE